MILFKFPLRSGHSAVEVVVAGLIGVAADKVRKLGALATSLTLRPFLDGCLRTLTAAEPACCLAPVGLIAVGLDIYDLG